MVYDLFLGTVRVGQANAERQGLYYRIECRCLLDANVRYRVYVEGERGAEDLGLLVPKGREFSLCSSVAIKKLGQSLQFKLIPGRKKSDAHFIPLCADAPFGDIDKLKYALLQRRDGTVGVLVQGVSSDSSKPTGQ